MTHEQAIELVNELVRASSDHTKVVNFSRRGSKSAATREMKAAEDIFKALTGDRATEEQSAQLVR
jgi:adenosylmethionine-8-amino-7-oxononanoate aminotransferase